MRGEDFTPLDDLREDAEQDDPQQGWYPDWTGIAPEEDDR